MRKSTIYFLFMAIGIVLFFCLTLHARQSQARARGRIAAAGELARKLKLTDLSLFTEARYTRHPSMADLHSPFQDHPFALDHFPSGSLVSLPRFHERKP